MQMNVFFYIFPDGNWPPCWIIKSIKFYMLTLLGEIRNITMLNYFKTGLSKAEILCFFDFPNGRRHHVLFLKSPDFFWLTVSRGSRLMSMSNFGKIRQSVAKYKDFSIFQNGGRRHLAFSNLWNFIGRQCLEAVSYTHLTLPTIYSV